MKFHLLIAGILIIAVLAAGCTYQSGTGTATPVPTTAAIQPKFAAGDIVAKTATSADTFWLIIRYDTKTDKYERALIFKSLHETWYRKDGKTEPFDRAQMEKLYPAKVFHVSSISAVPITTPTATAMTTTISVPAPSISSITPNGGMAGYSVSITNLAGTNFQMGATVKLIGFGGSSVTATSVVVSEKTITCIFNLHDLKAGKYDVVVTNPDGQSDILTDGFTVNEPGPIVSGIEPSEGMIGQTSISITITGSNFKDPVKVTFHNGNNDLVCYSPKANTATQISCLISSIPQGTATGFWDIEVLNIQDRINGTAKGKFTIVNATST